MQPDKVPAALLLAQRRPAPALSAPLSALLCSLLEVQ